MIWNKKFDYPPSIRSLINDQRHYDIGQEKLPSVTTILQATQSEEKKAILAKWKQKVGENKAEHIKNEAANRGTIMHRIIEGYITGEGHADLSDMGQAAGIMAQTIFKEGLKGSMEEVWGSEITLYYPGLYAGATDLVGIYEGRESIIDFKQSNKIKKREWIEDYFTQLAAYAMAHNYVYNTKIQSGVILMCTKDNYFQKFVVKDKEFQQYMWKWVSKVDQFVTYNQKKGQTFILKNKKIKSMLHLLQLLQFTKSIENIEFFNRSICYNSVTCCYNLYNSIIPNKRGVNCFLYIYIHTPFYVYRKPW